MKELKSYYKRLEKLDIIDIHPQIDEGFIILCCKVKKKTKESSFKSQIIKISDYRKSMYLFFIGRGPPDRTVFNPSRIQFL